MSRRYWESQVGRPVRAPVPRLASMILMLALVGVIYARAKEPATWRWLAPDNARVEMAAAGGAKIPASDREHETIVPGPTDEDPEEWAAARMQFEAITDKTPDIDRVEMPAYWRCLKWARAQSFDEMDRRAAKDVEYVRVLREPEKYRGKLIRISMRVMRALAWDAKENPAGVKQTTEAWGPDDSSRTYLYVGVTGDWPAELTTGESVNEQAEFVGYFLKLMMYKGADG